MAMIQRLTSRLRSLSRTLPPLFRSPPPIAASSGLLARPLLRSLSSWSSSKSISMASSSTSTRLSLGFSSVTSHPFPLSMIQVRHVVSSRDRRSKRRRATPLTSKLKKIKMKPYSSYKGRFRTLQDGTIRRWKEGKRHNAHPKSKEAKRRLRRPGIVHPAFARVMKKLNFGG